MEDLNKQREELIELFGVHFENIGHLPPLGSRILAMLIIDACTRPYTFEDLVEQMGASKSSISTNLNLLLKMGKITYYTRPGDRKKYYRPSEFSERFDNYLKMIAFEKGIMDKMVDYRKKTVSSQSEKFELQKSEAYKEHILEMEALLNKTIEKFRRIEKEGK
jgi:DNA-binding transcriptional regulator GbsR (MarR family)